MIDKIKSEKLIIVSCPNYFLKSNVSKAIAVMFDSIETKSEKYECFINKPYNDDAKKTNKHISIFIFDELDDLQLEHIPLTTSVKTCLIVSLQNVGKFSSLGINLNEHFIFNFDILYEGPSIEFSLTMCENDSYNILDLKENYNTAQVPISTSVLKMFPVLYKLIIRLMLLNKNNHLVFVEDKDKKIIFLDIFEELNITNFKIIDSSAENISKIGIFEHYHIVDFPNIQNFYKLCENHTIDKVYFKDMVQYWFYINEENFLEYKKFENDVNRDSILFEYLMKNSEKIQIDKNGDMIF